MATALQPSPNNDTADPQPRLFTAEEYHRVGEIGLFDGQRVELIDGKIVTMSPQGHSHATTVLLVLNALQRVFGTAYTCRPQMPLALGKRSEPEPDIAVVKGSPRDYDQTPTTALLVVEVSDSTRQFDRGEKAGLYARAAIPDYWVVDLIARKVVVHRQPKNGCYADIVEFGSGQSISLLSLPRRKVLVDDLFF